MPHLGTDLPIVEARVKTCDIRRGAENALSGTSLRALGASKSPFRTGVRAKGRSSTAHRRTREGRGALRLSRLLQPGKRSSWSLSERQAANLVGAARYAAELGLPFNRFVTINWEAAGVADCTSATGRFLKYVGDWLRRQLKSSRPPLTEVNRDGAEAIGEQSIKGMA